LFVFLETKLNNNTYSYNLLGARQKTLFEVNESIANYYNFYFNYFMLNQIQLNGKSLKKSFKTSFLP